MKDAIIKRPHLTEKSIALAENQERPVYTFVIASSATKLQVAKAVFSRFGVKPLRVNVVNTPAKKIFFRGRPGRLSGSRKAIVYLKEGDKIKFEK